MKVERFNDIDTIVVDNGSKTAIVVLHGYGASFQDLASLHQYLDKGAKYNWYFMDGPLSVDVGMGMSGKAWFPIDMMKLQQALMRGAFEQVFKSTIPSGIEEVIMKVKGAIEEINKERVFLGGFSQGSMVSLGLSLSKPELVEKMFLLSSTLWNEDGLKKEVHKLKDIPIFQSHGRLDPVLPYSMASSLREILEKNIKSTNFIPFDGGHEIPLSVINELSSFLGESK